jgi:hypothetical protein
MSEAGVTVTPGVAIGPAAGFTVKVTGRAGLTPQAVAVALMEPAYEPAANPLGFTRTVSVPGVVPIEEPMESQPPLLAGVTWNCAAPLLQVSDTVCAAGAAPPALAVKESEPALNVNVGMVNGCDALTTRDALTV